MILVRNIGIFAHVDAGKTTLTEQMLFLCGAIRAAGRVDEGTAHTDGLAVERERGISVRSSAACCEYRGVHIRIVDTPGHVDFVSEVESALPAIDAAVLVISAVEGVQAQTSVLIKAFSRIGLPLIVFVNKIDRPGADVPRVIRQLEQYEIETFRLGMDREEKIDRLTRYDESLIEGALEGTVSERELIAALRKLVLTRRLVPLVEGSALKGRGVASVLDAVVDCLGEPEALGVDSAYVYHILRKNEERQAHVRVYGGQIHYGMTFGEDRIKRLRRLTPEGFVNVDALNPGDIGAITGLNGLKAGQWLGAPKYQQSSLAQPVLSARVHLLRDSDYAEAQAALHRLHDEWPGLEPRYEPRTREIRVQVMGEIHRQVLEHALNAEYAVPCTLDEPAVVYRETPAKEGTGVLDMYISPWFAQATFLVRPIERGAGVRFRSEVSQDDLYLKYHRDIEAAVYRALNEGLTGWPVTDIEVVLTAGYCIRVKKPGSHFAPVVPLGLFAALKDAGALLLEPVNAFEVQVEEHCASKLIYDLTTMRARFDPPQYAGGYCIIEGVIPVATSMDYIKELHALTRGRGIWRTRFSGYEPCPKGEGQTIERTTPDPLNREVYMDYIQGISR